jgi:hypothetical protein
MSDPRYREPLDPMKGAAAERKRIEAETRRVIELRKAGLTFRAINTRFGWRSKAEKLYRLSGARGITNRNR